jgi:uncharacterized membrane protein (UPF0127 family)
MRSLRRLCFQFLLPLLLTLALGCGGEEGGQSASRDESPVPDTTMADGRDMTMADGRVVIRVGGLPVRVRVSQTPEEKERGLMFTEHLPADEGMLFVFKYEHRLDFWMKNTPIDLDVAFIDGRGRILEIRHMKAFDEQTIHRSRSPALYALEMNAGWFQEHGITVGDEVKF